MQVEAEAVVAILYRISVELCRCYIVTELMRTVPDRKIMTSKPLESAPNVLCCMVCCHVNVDADVDARIGKILM